MQNLSKIVPFPQPNNTFQAYLDQQQIRLAQSIVQNMLQILIESLMELDITTEIRASRYERKRSRKVYRNGYRKSMWKSHFGEVELHIPKLRKGTYYPQFLQHPNVEDILVHFITAVWIDEITIPKTQELVTKLGFENIRLSEVAQICETFHDFRERLSIHAEYEYLVLDIINHPRSGKRKLLLAIGVSADGSKELVNHQLVNHADQDSWYAFMQDLQRRGLQNIPIFRQSRTVGFSMQSYLFSSYSFMTTKIA